MACIARILFVIILLISGSSYAAIVTQDADSNSLSLKLTFSKGYSNVNTLKLDKSYVVSFETNEELNFEQTYWDMPITDIFVTSDGSRKRFIAKFESAIIVPEVISQEKVLKITFNFPKVVEEAPTVGGKAYARMVWGLLIILAFVLVLFWVIKKLYKKQVDSEVPGMGLLVGKVDIDIRKSVYFYEVDETLYIIGSTDTSMNLLDKIEDETKVTRIKTGFRKKNDFGAYMKFFKKNPTIKDEVENSRDAINERLESLKKR